MVFRNILVPLAMRRRALILAHNLVEDLALLLGAGSTVQSFRLSLSAVDIEFRRLGKALLLAKGEGDRLVVVLAAAVTVWLLAGQQAVVAGCQRRLVALRSTGLRLCRLRRLSRLLRLRRLG